MKRDFDFNKVGKRMPYTVPDNFFTEMEDNVYLELNAQPPVKTRRHRTFMRMAITALTTAAATVALVLILDKGPHAVHTTGFAEVEQAFGNLGAEDQVYLFSVYQDDIFMNE
ncbi:MAG: hypothetical protein Q4D36_09415 [Bacteroidales bacterium]|nr:hypothetical protein [Bacteroidales bacterium]